MKQRCVSVLALAVAVFASGCSSSSTDPSEDTNAATDDNTPSNSDNEGNATSDPDVSDPTTPTVDPGDMLTDDVTEPTADPMTDEPQQGVCGQRGMGTVDTEGTFDGYQEFFIIGDGGLGVDVCVVRFTATRVGDAPPGCNDFAGQQDECLWTHEIELSDPEVVLDDGDVCAGSSLGLDAEGIAAIDGTQAAYGYVFEYSGHASVLLKYEETTQTWEPNGTANWDPETNDFRFERRDGFCDF